MVEKPKLITFTGFAYAGKTTFGRQLAAEIGAKHCASDSIVSKLYDEGFPLETRRHYSTMGAALTAGMTVINDRLHLTPEYRAEPEHFAQEKGVAHALIWVQASSEEIWRRWETNQQTHERTHYPRERVLWVLENYIPPGRNEKHIIFRSGVDDFSEWIHNNSI